jgi:(2R)-3-sulfolactate dehydrogenase (NADP+)
VATSISTACRGSNSCVPTFTLPQLTDIATRALLRAGARDEMAVATARALVAAEAQGLSSHGMSRVLQYAVHLRNGRVDGRAEPKIVKVRGSVLLVDAGSGLAFPGCAMAVAECVRRAREHGVAFAGIRNSHHFGVAAYHLLPVAAAGMVGLAFGNSPAAMPAAGGRRPLFGTNPIAAIFPRRADSPITVDLSLSEAARGKVMVAAARGEPIPAGWALDRDGVPTMDANAALGGSMLPAGGSKGAMLALVVELLTCALTGAAFGFEADSFFVDEGNRPRIGQAFLVIDPDALAGRDAYLERVETLVAAMLADPGVRLPGQRREALAAVAARDGVGLAPGLADALERLAAD